LFVAEPIQEELPETEDSVFLIEPSPTMEAMVAPRFLQPMEDLQAVDGQEIKMTCRVSGTPMPKVSFFHDSKNIDEDEEFVITYDSETGEVRCYKIKLFFH
jgi:hypothetical protein